MKPTLRLMLTLVVLAGLAALPSLATPVQSSACSTVAPEPGLVPADQTAPAPAWLLEGRLPGSGPFECAQFCMIALCPDGACGPFIDEQGQQRCGCHSGVGPI